MIPICSLFVDEQIFHYTHFNMDLKCLKGRRGGGQRAVNAVAPPDRCGWNYKRSASIEPEIASHENRYIPPVMRGDKISVDSHSICLEILSDRYCQ